MSRLVLSSDLHLGHKNITNYRTRFNSAEEHHEYVLLRHKETIQKNDTWYCLGDVAFTLPWLMRLKEIHCKRKVLILGNHELEKELTMGDLLKVFDAVYSLKAHKAYGAKMWFSHCPIHPAEMRSKDLNIHGHTHDYHMDDPRFVNLCVEHTDFGVVSLEEVIKRKQTLIDYNKGVLEWKEECESTLQQKCQMGIVQSLGSGVLRSTQKMMLNKKYLKAIAETTKENLSSATTALKSILQR